MNYIGLNLCDLTNGPGARVSLFVSGCRLHCKGCFNKESWDFNSGKPFTLEVRDSILRALNDPYISGLSLLGGDPMEPEHEDVLIDLCSLVPSNKTIYCWTGRTLNQIKDRKLLKYIDVLIDGPFVESKKDSSLLWRGSSNQRIINIGDKIEFNKS